MSKSPVFRSNSADVGQICELLRRCDDRFIPTLSSRIDVEAYAAKIAQLAERFEAWAGQSLVGLVASYCNDPNRDEAFVTNVSVLPEWSGRGLGVHLMQQCITHVEQLGFRRVSLEVGSDNTPAIRLYEKCGFYDSVAAVAGSMHVSRFRKGGE